MRGDSIFYYPRTKDSFTGDCAKAAETDFNQNASFEENASSGYSGGGW